jgi:hypothetical protein
MGSRFFITAALGAFAGVAVAKPVVNSHAFLATAGVGWHKTPWPKKFLSTLRFSQPTGAIPIRVDPRKDKGYDASVSSTRVGFPVRNAPTLPTEYGSRCREADSEMTMQLYTRSITFIALRLSINIKPAKAQTMAFNRQFSTPGIDRVTAVAADASDIYVIGIDLPRKAVQAELAFASTTHSAVSRGLWSSPLLTPLSTGFIGGAADGDSNRAVRTSYSA